MSRLGRFSAVAALAVSLLVVVGPGPVASPAAAGTTTYVTACTDDGPRPCIQNVLRNGEPLDGDWSYLAEFDDYPSTSTVDVSFNAMSANGFDLGFDSLDDTWQVTIDLGEVVPRGVFGAAQDVTVERGSSSVTVTGHPVTVSGQCHGDWQCPEWADDPDRDDNNQWDGDFGFVVSELPFEDADLLDHSYGLDVFTNVAGASIIPDIRHDDATNSDYLWFRLANRHYYEDGTTVVQGRLEVRIPNALLRAAYGIPDPELMTEDSLDPVVTGEDQGSGTISVSQAAGGDAMLVRISGVTFSRRAARIGLGVIVPTRPRGLEAHRTGRSTHLTFKPSHARGARVHGYEARCRSAAGNRPVVLAHGRSPILVTGMRRGVRYECAVRARSQAGAGPWTRVTT